MLKYRCIRENIITESNVLYFGDRPWKNERTLYEVIGVTNELKPFVNNYNVNVFEIAYLTDEQLTMFKSDFRIVADFFVHTRKNKDYIPSKDTIRHSKKC